MVLAEGQPWGPGSPPRLDVDGVGWHACDPYPTWFRFAEDGMTVIHRPWNHRWNFVEVLPWIDETLCPVCERQTIRVKELGEGGGIECRDRVKCRYWYCA